MMVHSISIGMFAAAALCVCIASIVSVARVGSRVSAAPLALLVLGAGLMWMLGGSGKEDQAGIWSFIGATLGMAGAALSCYNAIRDTERQSVAE